MSLGGSALDVKRSESLPMSRSSLSSLMGDAPAEADVSKALQLAGCKCPPYDTAC